MKIAEKQELVAELKKDISEIECNLPVIRTKLNRIIFIRKIIKISILIITSVSLASLYFTFSQSYLFVIALFLYILMRILFPIEKIEDKCRNKEYDLNVKENELKSLKNEIKDLKYDV